MKKLLSVLLAIVSVFTFVFFAVGSGDDEASIDEQFEIEQGGEYYEEGEVEGPDQYIYTGESAYADGVLVAFDDFDYYEYYSEYFPPEYGNEIVYFDVTLQNDNSYDITITNYEFTCYYDGYVANEYYYADDGLSSVVLSPGQVETVRVYYEISEATEDIELVFDEDKYTSGSVTLIF